MAFVSRVAESYANSSEFYADGVNGLHALLLAAGWTVHDELDATPGSEDRVYLALGEDGTEKLYLRVTHNLIAERLYFRAYGFWDEVNHTGYFEIGDDAGATAIQLGVTMTGWMAVDRDGIILVAKVGSDYHKFFARRLVRNDPYGQRGRTTLAAQKPGYNQAGDNKLFLDSAAAFTEFGPGYVWVVNQKIDSGVNAELVEVLSVDAVNRAFVLNAALVNSYDFGALVAQNPVPLVLVGDLAGVLEAAEAYSFYDPGSFGSSVVTMPNLLGSILSAADDYGNLPSSPLVFSSDEPGQRNVKGSSGDFFVEVPWASVSDEDTVELMGNNYVIFREPSRAFALKVS